MKKYSEQYSIKKVCFFSRIPTLFLSVSIVLLVATALLTMRIEGFIVVPILLGILVVPPVYFILGAVCHHKILEIIYLQKILESKCVKVESLLDELRGESSYGKFDGNMNF